MKKGYILYTTEKEDNTKDCFFSYKNFLNDNDSYFYNLVKSVEVHNLEDIATELHNNGYDGEYIECFLQENVPYSFI